MNCLYCQSERTVKNGAKTLKTGQRVQNYLCHECGRQFNERSGTPMAHLKTPVETVELAIKVRGEGLGLRATARVLGKSPGSIIHGEEHLSAKLREWSPPAPNGGDITMEGDEVYTRVGENLPPRSV